MRPDTSILNGLRAAAAFWVLFAHCAIWTGVYDVLPIPSPKIAVDVFMVLSGFLMHLTTTERWSVEPLTQAGSIGRFYIRRLFRLAPVYYLAIAFVALASSYLVVGYLNLQALDPAHWQGQSAYDPSLTKYTFDNIIWHASFLAGLSPSYSVRTFLPDWSLSLEAQFYFFFPLIAILFRRLGPILPSIVLTTVCILLLKKFVGFAEPSVLLLRLPVFLAGMLLYEACLSNSKAVRSAYIATAVGLCLYLYKEYGWSVLWLLSAVVLIPAVAINDNPLFDRLTWLRRICHSRVVQSLADASYSVYLFHGAIIALVGSRVASALLSYGLSPIQTFLSVSVVVAICATALALLIFRLIERPFIKLGGRVLALWRNVPTGNPSEHRSISSVEKTSARTVVSSEELDVVR